MAALHISCEGSHPLFLANISNLAGMWKQRGLESKGAPNLSQPDGPFCQGSLTPEKMTSSVILQNRLDRTYWPQYHRTVECTDSIPLTYFYVMQCADVLTPDSQTGRHVSLTSDSKNTPGLLFNSWLTVTKVLLNQTSRGNVWTTFHHVCFHVCFPKPAAHRSHFCSLLQRRCLCLSLSLSTPHPPLTHTHTHTHKHRRIPIHSLTCAYTHTHTGSHKYIQFIFKKAQ